MDLILIRHPAVGTAPGLCYGQSDVPLAAPAVEGAHTTARALEGMAITPSIVFSSHLTRCASVADLLSRQYGCPLESDSRLSELDFGAWEMQRWDDIARDEIDAWARDIEHARPHGGESVATVATRTGDWLADIEQRTDIEGHAIVLTHAGVIRVMTARALGLPALACIDWPIGMSGICRLVRPRDHARTRWTLAHWSG